MVSFNPSSFVYSPRFSANQERIIQENTSDVLNRAKGEELPKGSTGQDNQQLADHIEATETDKGKKKS